MTQMRRRSGVEIMVDGRMYVADTPATLRNVLLDLRNQFNNAAYVVEQEMVQSNDPMLKHISRLERMP